MKNVSPSQFINCKYIINYFRYVNCLEETADRAKSMYNKNDPCKSIPVGLAELIDTLYHPVIIMSDFSNGSTEDYYISPFLGFYKKYVSVNSLEHLHGPLLSTYTCGSRCIHHFLVIT